MSKFNKRIDEMLVVLNAVKKPKKDKDEKEPKVDPVTDLMNDTLGRFGVNVLSDKPETDSEEDEEDPIEGSLDDIGDLDLPRPADDADDEPASDDDEGDENGVGAPSDRNPDGTKGEDEDGSQDFDFMGVGSPVDTKSTETDNFKDDGEEDVSGEGKVKFEFCPGKGVVLGIGDEEATLSKEQIETVKQFLSTLPEDFDAEDEQGENPFGNSEDDDSDKDSDDSGDDDSEDGEDDDSDDEKGFGEARFDDPNPPSKKCKCGGTMSYDKHNQQYKCPKCHAWERGKSNL